MTRSEDPVTAADSPTREARDAAAFGREAVKAYELPASATVRLVGMSENATFLVEDALVPIAVLRIYRPNYQRADSIKSELAWIDAVRASGSVRTPKVRRTVDGEMFRWVDVGGEVRACAMFDYVAGHEPGLEDMGTYALVGGLAAALHQQVQRWERPAWFVRPNWNVDSILGPDAAWGLWINGPGLTSEGVDLLRRAETKVRANLADYPADGPNGGLVHCDLRAANLIVAGNDDVWVIDFDDSGFSWFLWDLCSTTTLIEHLPRVGDVVAAWLRGYRNVRSLTARDLAAIPDLIFLRRLHLLAWLGTHPEADLHRELADTYATETCAIATRYLAGEYLVEIANDHHAPTDSAP